jgi:WD40 repeat protein
VANPQPQTDITIHDEAENERFCFKGHTARISAVRFSPDGRYIESYAVDGLQMIWVADSGKVVLSQKWPAAPDPMEPGQFRFERPHSGPRRGFIGRTIFTDVPRNTMPGFSSDGRRVALGTPDGGVKVWDLADGKEVFGLKAVAGCLFSPDGLRLLTADAPVAGERPSPRSKLRLWDVATGKEIAVLQGAARGSPHAFSPDGKLFVGILWPEAPQAPAHPGPDAQFKVWTRIKLWDARTGAEVATLGFGTPFGYGVSASGETLAFSPDGTRIALSVTPSRGQRLGAAFNPTPGEILLWDVATGKELFRLKGHTSQVNSVAFSPDGKRLASAAQAEVKLWDAAAGKELLTLKRLSPRGFGFTRDGDVSFSRDGTRLFVHQDKRGPGPIWQAWDATPLPEKR